MQEHHHLIDRIAIVNAVVSGITLYPQLYLLYNSRYDDGILSESSFLLIFLNSVIWLWFGAHRRNYPLMVSSFLNAVAAFSIFFLLMVR